MIAELQNGYLISNTLLVYLIEDKIFKEIHYLYMSIIRSNNASCFINETILKEKGFIFGTYPGVNIMYYKQRYSTCRIHSDRDLHDPNARFWVAFYEGYQSTSQPFLIRSTFDLDELIKIWTTGGSKAEELKWEFMKTHEKF